MWCRKCLFHHSSPCPVRPRVCAFSDLPMVAAERLDLSQQHQLWRQRYRRALSKHAWMQQEILGAAQLQLSHFRSAMTEVHSKSSSYVCMALHHPRQFYTTCGSGANQSEHGARSMLPFFGRDCLVCFQNRGAESYMDIQVCVVVYLPFVILSFTKLLLDL